jgi:hypothetical protein
MGKLLTIAVVVLCLGGFWVYNRPLDLSFGSGGYQDTGRLTQGGGILASSTSKAALTMPVSYLTNYSGMEYTIAKPISLTLPASSTMTTFIPGVGDMADWYFSNETTTAASSTTIMTGTGLTLLVPEGQDIVIENGQRAMFTFIRKADKDVDVEIRELVTP